jgi:hypothetical protein
MTIERRDQVLIGRRSLLAAAVSTFFSRWVSTNGPLNNDRGTYLSPFTVIAQQISFNYALALSTPTNNESIRALVLTGFESFRWHAPWRHWMTSSRRFTFTTAMWVINWVHSDPAHCRSLAAPAVGTRFTQRTQVMLTVAYLAKRRAAFAEYSTHFT